jgi:hypothetical protein
MQARQDHDKYVEDPGYDAADPEFVDDSADLRPARQMPREPTAGPRGRDASRRHEQQLRDNGLLQQLLDEYPHRFRVHDPAMMSHTADRTDQPPVGAGNAGQAIRVGTTSAATPRRNGDRPEPVDSRGLACRSGRGDIPSRRSTPCWPTARHSGLVSAAELPAGVERDVTVWTATRAE